MTTIDNSKNYCTLINVFTVSPEKHLELFELLKEATEKDTRGISSKAKYINAKNVRLVINRNFV